VTRRVRGDPTRAARALRSPVARSRRLELRLPDLAFAPELVRLLNDPTIARWTMSVPYPYRRSDALRWYRRWRSARRTGRSLRFLLVRRSDGALLGGAGLHDIDPEHLRAEIGYWVGRPFRGQGYAQEAVLTICRLAFRRLRLRRVEAGIFPGNVRSARVLRATGFRLEGTMRKTVRKHGISRDVELYARLSDDPPGPARARRAPRRGSSAAPTR